VQQIEPQNGLENGQHLN